MKKQIISVLLALVWLSAANAETKALACVEEAKQAAVDFALAQDSSATFKDVGVDDDDVEYLHSDIVNNGAVEVYNVDYYWKSGELAGDKWPLEVIMLPTNDGKCITLSTTPLWK